MAADPLALFADPVAGWFRQAFGAPTPPQASGWPPIARGEHTLILAPTGSGKTLAAFLWGLDALFRELRETPEPERASKLSRYVPGVRIVYVSPLKALNNDVERNLQVPLAGIRARASEMGDPLPPVRAAVRTGDTPASERATMLRRPPQILITTPESLYLMLTGERARQMFATTHTVIVDEIHTLVGTKRGAHLALSLERLGRLSERPLQRLGLSATVHPLAEAARFLGGQDGERRAARPADGEALAPEGRDDRAVETTPRPVTVVDAGYRKPLDLKVITPVDDFRHLPSDSVWTAIIPEVVRQIESHRTTLVFCNSRRLAERTADRLNERRLLEKTGRPDGPAAEASGGGARLRRGALGADVGIFAAGVDVGRLEAAGLEPIRAHHGSMSRAARLEMEASLKGGRLAALVATSSLELGIDIGEIDLVVHLQSPKSVGSGLQRVGRGGHLVGQTSVGRIYTTFVEDVMEAAAVASGMLAGEIEETRAPANPLDVLAQQVAAMVGTEDWDYDELLALVRRAYPFHNLAERQFRGVLDMLAGRYPAEVSRQLRPRIGWDRVNNRLAALPGARNVAIQSGGTIPDRGTYALVLPDRRTRVGELDEEFVFETRRGDTFLLGSQVWRALEIADDRVIAEPAPGEVPRMPFWRGDYPWRPYDLGRRIGAFRRRIAEAIQTIPPPELDRVGRLLASEVADLADNRTAEGIGPAAAELVLFLHRDCALDRASIGVVVDHVRTQVAVVGAIATDRTIVVELFEDPSGSGEPRMVVHSPFGGRVNGPWAIALAGALRERLGVEPQINSGDDGFLLRFASADIGPPSDVVRRMTSREARERLLADLPGSAVFGAQFRMNAARALLLPRERAGKRTPLWLTRLRAKDLMQAVARFDDFPIVLETYRDCLRDVMDLAGLTEVLEGVERGEIRVVVHEAELPSPTAIALERRFAMQYVYEYDAPRGERQLATALSLDRTLLAELLQDGSLAELLRPEAIDEVAARVEHRAVDARARSAEELAQILLELGDLSTPEIAERCLDDRWHEWVARLAGAGRIVERRIGDQTRWVHAERQSDYDALARDPGPVLRRRLLALGPTATATLAHRYGLDEAAVRAAFDGPDSQAVAGRFSPGGAAQWVDRRNLEQIHRRTLSLLRREVRPVPLASYAAFLRQWQGIRDTPGRGDASEVAWRADPNPSESTLSGVGFS